MPPGAEHLVVIPAVSPTSSVVFFWFLGKAAFWQRCETRGAHNRCAQMAGTLDAARSELETAGERQQEIDGFVAVENKKLEALKAERAVKGSGRPNTAHSSKVKASGAKIARLMRNILPSEQAPYVPRTMFELVTSAATHPQHHAAAGAVPAGRRSDAKRSRDADDDDDDDDDDGGNSRICNYFQLGNN